MNNLEHVLHFLDTIPETLNIEAVLQELGQEHGQDRIGSFRDTLDDVIHCAQEDMKLKLDEIIVKTGDRVRTFNYNTVLLRFVDFWYLGLPLIIYSISTKFIHLQ